MTEKAKNILETIRYATVSSVDNNGIPWAAPVWYVIDNEENLYWWSPIDSQHSRNIVHNSNIYITIFNSTVAEGDGLGLYLRAEAGVVVDNELDVAIEHYNSSTRIFKLDRENCTGNAPTRMYKAIVSQQWINESIEQDGFYIDKRIEL